MASRIWRPMILLTLLPRTALPALFGRKEHPVEPFYRDRDGYYLRKETLAVYDGRLQSTTLPTTPTTESTESTEETTSESTTTGVPDWPASGTGPPPSFWKYQYNVLGEKELARRRVAQFPSGGIANSSLVNDDLISVSGVPPINPVYRDRTNPFAWYEKNVSVVHDGWQINSHLKSRSKRCKNFSCPLESVNTISGIESCIAATAPGCVLEYEGSMDLLEQAALCCFDGPAMQRRDGVPEDQGVDNKFTMSNYTWFLPTPPLAIELALRGNVSTFARIKRPWKTGFYTGQFLHAGFAITKMNAACSDYKWFDLAPHTAKIANPSPCVSVRQGEPISSQLDYQYIDCHGWASTETKESWNRTNARQLIFSSVIDRMNCITVAGQYQLLTARLTFGTLVRPPAGAAVQQKRLKYTANENPQLEYGYDEYPAIDALYR